MARKLNGSSQYLEHSAAALSGPPFTFACWALVTALPSANQALLSLSNSGGGNLFQLQVRGAASGKPIGMQVSSGSNSQAVTSAGPSANVWFHAAGWVASSTSRAAYLNGGNKGTDSTSIANPTGLNETDVGVYWSSTGRAGWFAGAVAEAAIWNAVLSDAEIAALAAGVLPRRVRPQNLLAYWPLGGLLAPEPDLSGNAQNLTVAGATAANHAPVTLLTPKKRTPCDVLPAMSAFSIHRPFVSVPRLHPVFLE